MMNNVDATQLLCMEGVFIGKKRQLSTQTDFTFCEKLYQVVQNWVIPLEQLRRELCEAQLIFCAI